MPGMFDKPISYEYEGTLTRCFRWSNVPPLQKAVLYDGEKVWTGDWFGAPLYPGPRCLIDLRGAEFPAMIDEKRYNCGTGGKLRQALWAASTSEHFKGKRYALDGVLATRDAEGRYDFGTITKVTMHMPPTAVVLADDLYRFSVVKAGEGSSTFMQRRKLLRSFAGEVEDERVIVTKYERIETRDDFKRLRDQCLSVEGFGMILRQDAPYVSGKSGHLLKIEPGDG